MKIWYPTDGVSLKFETTLNGQRLSEHKIHFPDFNGIQFKKYNAET